MPAEEAIDMATDEDDRTVVGGTAEDLGLPEAAGDEECSVKVDSVVAPFGVDAAEWAREVADAEPADAGTAGGCDAAGAPEHPASTTVTAAAAAATGLLSMPMTPPP